MILIFKRIKTGLLLPSLSLRVVSNSSSLQRLPLVAALFQEGCLLFSQILIHSDVFPASSVVSLSLWSSPHHSPSELGVNFPKAAWHLVLLMRILIPPWVIRTLSLWQRGGISSLFLPALKSQPDVSGEKSFVLLFSPGNLSVLYLSFKMETLFCSDWVLILLVLWIDYPLCSKVQCSVDLFQHGSLLPLSSCMCMCMCGVCMHLCLPQLFYVVSSLPWLYSNSQGLFCPSLPNARIIGTCRHARLSLHGYRKSELRSCLYTN